MMYKLGIAGYGRIVELVHIPIIKKTGSIEITDVYDITGERLDVAKNRGVRTHTDISAFLQSNTDIVLIASPPSSHFAIAAEALKKGKHVIIEKPVTTTLEDAVALKDLSEKTGKKIFAFHNRRFTPDYLLVKKNLENDELGRINYIARSHNQPQDSVSFGVKAFDPEWRIKEEFGGGALFDWGIHLIDQLISLVPGSITSVQSFTHRFDPSVKGAEDYVSATMITDSDAVLKFEVNFRSHMESPNWTVNGEKKSLLIRNGREAVYLEKGKTTETLEIEKESRFLGIEIYESLLETIETDRPPVISMDDVIKGMEIIAAIRNRN